GEVEGREQRDHRGRERRAGVGDDLVFVGGAQREERAGGGDLAAVRVAGARRRVPVAHDVKGRDADDRRPGGRVEGEVVAEVAGGGDVDERPEHVPALRPTAVAAGQAVRLAGERAVEERQEGVVLGAQRRREEARDLVLVLRADAVDQPHGRDVILEGRDVAGAEVGGHGAGYDREAQVHDEGGVAQLAPARQVGKALADRGHDRRRVAARGVDGLHGDI